MTERTPQTIFALSSGPGRAGVAVIRLSGPDAGGAVDCVAGSRPLPRHATVRTFRDPENGEKIDKGLVLWMPAPQSFTGEDCAEFHLHGGAAVINAVINALSTCPNCRLAEAGEFSRRAFDNGKLDLTEAEGVADLIAAETEAQRKQAFDQASGALSALYERWRSQLIEAAALTEAALDFSDEGDVSKDALAKAHTRIVQVMPEIQGHLDDGHRGEILRDGFRVVLAGPPNVGKSSLLNALARRDVAIVSHHAGTTRDIVEVRLDLNGFPVLLSDTAGLRSDAGDIEREGMRRAQQTAKAAQLVLWLTDDPRTDAEPPANLVSEAGEIVSVLSKSDLHDTTMPPKSLAVSAKTGAGLDTLIEHIARAAEQRLACDSVAPALTQARHRQALRQCVENLAAFIAGPLQDAELRAEDLRQAITALGRITGRVDVEDILDQVFGQFCIGK